MNKKILISFSITIFLLIFAGFVSVVKMMELAESTKKLYEHPFIVTNATKTIKSNIISMHRYMKDVALAETPKEIDKAIESVNVNERNVYREFNIVFKKYLGNKDDIQKSYDAFVAWKPIRDEVILLRKMGKKQESANITKGKGARYVADLNTKVTKMILYAHNKAEYFKENAIQNEENYITLIVVLFSVILFIVISILVILLKNISNTEKSLKEYFHLIDQNIMSAKLDTGCSIIESSSSLARYLGMSKEELLQTSKHFIISDCSQELQEEIQRTIQSGQEWHGEIYKLIKDDEVKWLKAQITPQFDAGYNVVSYTNILQDISDKKELEEVSRLDGLTSLYNRRYFDEEFEKNIKRAVREKQVLHFVMIDIDHFKLYNDTYGHQAGDTTLKKVAHTLHKFLNRPDDYLFRLGGEEFGMLYMTSEKENGIEIAQRTKEAIEELKIKHETSKTSEFVTVSMGVYALELNDKTSADDIYRYCDEALYEAKNRGRNRIEVV